MKQISETLSQAGISSYFPMEEERDLNQGGGDEVISAIEKGNYIQAHLFKIQCSNKVLVVNYPKNDVEGYIGPNSLIELAFGYALGKELYLLHELGEQNCKPEVMGMQPTILNGKLDVAQMVKM